MSNNCPLCGSAFTKPSYSAKESSYYRCADCGLFFLRTVGNSNFDSGIQDFETAYLNYLSPKASDQKNHELLLNWMHGYMQEGQNDFMDIGCGGGKFVRFLIAEGYNATGIEPSDALYRQFLASASCFFHSTPNQFLQRYPLKKFDVLTVFDVLEHVQEPMDFLRDVTALMNPGGLLFLSTPDTNSLHRKLAGKRWHYFNKYHFSLFNKNNLDMAAKKAGLLPVSYNYFSRYFSTAYLKEYFNDFILRKKSVVASTKQGFVIPINLYDNLYAVLQKPTISNNSPLNK